MEHFHQNIYGGGISYPSVYKNAVETFPTGAHFVEIGSLWGGSAAYMAVEIVNSGKKIKFDCIDTWKGSTEHNLITEDQQENLYRSFLKNIEPVKDIVTPIRTTSELGAKLYKDASLDFVFIDAAHDYNNVILDIKTWYPKVKPKGIIAGHDYDWPGVRQAVDEYFVDKRIDIVQLCWIYVKS